MSKKKLEDLVNLTNEELDIMLNDLTRTYATDHTEYDESSKQLGLHNHIFDRKISDLTIYEFSSLIRDIVRKEIREAVSELKVVNYFTNPNTPWAPPTWDPNKWNEPYC